MTIDQRDEMRALKPCPFCGAIDAHHQSDYGDESQFVCAVCDARGPMKREYAASLIAWNTRNPDAEALAGALEEMLPAFRSATSGAGYRGLKARAADAITAYRKAHPNEA